MKPITIVAITVGDLAGIAILAAVILYIYHYRKHKTPSFKTAKSTDKKRPIDSEKNPQTNQKKPSSSVLFCLANKGEETSEATSSSDGEEQREKPGMTQDRENRDNKKNGVLVTVDGETELELETLLKASAYIVGASGGSIVYKAVLEDGTALAVRRIGDVSVERLRDFESQVRGIAKIRHQNLVKIRGLFWGEDEKLIIYDYVSNGCLSTSLHSKYSAYFTFHSLFSLRSLTLHQSFPLFIISIFIVFLLLNSQIGSKFDWKRNPSIPSFDFLVQINTSTFIFFKCEGCWLLLRLY